MWYFWLFTVSEMTLPIFPCMFQRQTWAYQWIVFLSVVSPWHDFPYCKPSYSWVPRSYVKYGGTQISWLVNAYMRHSGSTRKLEDGVFTEASTRCPRCSPVTNFALVENDKPERRLQKGKHKWSIWTVLSENTLMNWDFSNFRIR